MKNKIKTGLLSIVAVAALTGCNVSVGAGHLGKVLGPNGWESEI